MKAIIGITPLYDEKLSSIWMIPGYCDAVADAGCLPVILPLRSDRETVESVAELCDGILLTGGQDVEPTLYGKERTDKCGEPCRVKDELECALALTAKERDIPVLGICRGLQLMNVAFGGTLVRDLPTEAGRTGHAMTPPYDRTVHGVKICEGMLRDLFGTDGIRVNSYHHQAVDRLAPCLKAAAVSDDGVTEAAYLPGASFFVGVQWHPELRRDEYSRALFAALARSAENRKAARERRG